MREPLILIPGLLCDERLWESQTVEFGGKYEISVADISKDDSIESMARRILETSPDTFSLAGLSMGGYVALAVARLAPERVEKLALLDTSARSDTPEQTDTRLDLIRLAKESGLEEVAHKLLPKLLHPSRLDDEKLVEMIAAMALSTGIEAFERQERAIMNRPDSREAIPSIECPTLVLCGREDAITPPTLHKELAENIPGSTLRIIEKCGHLSTLERPEKVNDTLGEWLG